MNASSPDAICHCSAELKLEWTLCPFCGLPANGNELDEGLDNSDVHEVLLRLKELDSAELDSLIVLQTMGEHLRFFVGYAGWESGQLEAEVDQDGWHLTPATPSCVFETPPERLWHHLIAKTSPSLSWLKHLPDDPSMN